MANYQIINEYKEAINEIGYLSNFIEYCTEKLLINDALFNIVIIDDDKIHELNRVYREIDRATDVISFALEDDDTVISDERILGDIYISYDHVISQAKEYGHSEKRELCFLAVHGLLHLLGYDHMNKEDEDKMFKLQKELLDNYGIKKES